MGNIRGTHKSPGIYHTLKTISRNKPKEKYKTPGMLKSDTKSGGGNIPTPPIVKYWVFGDTFPAVFS